MCMRMEAAEPLLALLLSNGILGDERRSMVAPVMYADGGGGCGRAENEVCPGCGEWRRRRRRRRWW